MKRIFYLFFILIVSGCSGTEEIETSEPEVSISLPIPRISLADTIRKHEYFIPFWKWGEYQPNHYLENPGTTKIRFKDFTFKVDGLFETATNPETGRKVIYEEVGWYFQGRKFWIDSQNDSDTYALELAAYQTVNEQFNQAWWDDPKFDYENWDKKSLHYDELSSYYRIADSSDYHRISWTNDFYEKRFIQTHETRDTMRYFPGEMGGSTATMIFKEQICIYGVEYGIIKITRTSPKGVKSEHFVEISYSYGC